MISVKTSGGKCTITCNVGAIAGGINCGNVCSASVAPGTMVMLTAGPDAGFTFMALAREGIDRGREIGAG